jgi:ATP-dependent DNA helicase RecQ
VLRGRDTERVRQWNHHQLGVFGVGADLDEAAWRNVFRQLVALGYARPDHQAYGALRLAESSRPVLKGEQQVEMRRVVPRRSRMSRARSASHSDIVPAADILDMLRAWRMAQAREQSVPAYVIFHDRTLTELAARQPQDLDALAAVSGMGAKKLERYGMALLALLKA